MNLEQVLELQHANAVVAGENRDRRVSVQGLEKKASVEKDAGLRDAWHRLVQIAKIPFTKSPLQVAQEKLQKKVLMQAAADIADQPIRANFPTQEAHQQALNLWGGARLKHQITQKTMKQVPTRSQTFKEVEEVKDILDPAGMLQRTEVLKRKVPVTTETLHEVTETVYKHELGPTNREIVDNARRVLETTQKPSGSKVPMGLALGGIGVVAAMPALDDLRTKYIHDSNKRDIANDDLIPDTHKVKAQEAFQVLATYAPSIAANPIMSRDFSRMLIRYDNFDTKLVSDLISAEKTFQESKGKKAEFLRSLSGTVFGTMLGMGG